MSIISVVGAGYVGLTTGACLAELGHQVIFVDTDSARISTLSRGEIPIHEPDLPKLIQRHRELGNLRFTDNYALAIPQSTYVFIAVNTPPRYDGHADTRHVISAAASIIEHATPGLVVVMKSTVPVGTGDQVAHLVDQSERSEVSVVSNPEFLREGSAIRDFMEPDRVVIGADNSGATCAMMELYRDIEAEKVLCSRRSAELSKYASNAFLATRISFMNEIAAICEASGADIDEVMHIVGADRRIGRDYLKSGLGWGGSCFPKDVQSLVATAAAYGCSADIMDAVVRVNFHQRQRAVDLLLGALASVPDPKVGVLGLAFKPDTDDLRQSPAVEIISQLGGAGVKVRAHDPVAVPKARLELPDIHYCDDAYEVAQGSDALLLATEWSDYMALDWNRVASLMRRLVVVDGRNALNGPLLAELGFSYFAFGRPRLGFSHTPSNPVEVEGLEAGSGAP